MLQTAIQQMWPEKYRPKTIDDYIFQNPSHKKSFKRIVESGITPHLLLAGIQGTGKSAIAQIIIDACVPDEDDRDIDVLKLNASDDNSVENIREEVRSHIMSYSSGKYKIVWLEEADRLSPAAQDILRDYMETYEQQARFILSCNHVHKIINPVQSRCQKYMFTACDKIEATEMAAKILQAEKIKCNLTVLDKHVDLHYPDMRSIINSLQQYSHDGILEEPEAQSTIQDAKMIILELIQKDKWMELERSLSTSIVDEEWEDVFTFLYQNLDKSPKFKNNNDLWGEGIVLISDHIINHVTHGKPAINGSSLLIQLNML